MRRMRLVCSNCGADAKLVENCSRCLGRGWVEIEFSGQGEDKEPSGDELAAPLIVGQDDGPATLSGDVTGGEARIALGSGLSLSGDPTIEADGLADLFVSGRHVKHLWISAQLLLQALFSPRLDGGDEVRAVTVEGLPRDFTAQAVRYDETREAFCFRIDHPSFPRVPDCHAIPELTVQCRERRFRVQR